MTDREFAGGLPEAMRERLLARLEGESGFVLPSREGLEELAQIRSADEPVVSLYLTLTPERRVKGAWDAAFRDLARQALARVDDRRRRTALEELLARVEGTLRDALPGLGRGVAVFACPGIGLWRQVALPLPLPDRVELADRPWVRPLARTFDEHERFVVAVLAREQSRVVVSQTGYAAELVTVSGERLKGITTDWVPPQERQAIGEELTQREGKALARLVTWVTLQADARHVLVSVSEKLRPAFMAHLPKALAERLAGEFAVEPHVSVAELAGIVEPLQRAVEEREELATVGRLEEAGPDRAWWGLGPVLEALTEQRVMTLVVADGYASPGSECGGCGLLSAAADGQCPACGADLVAADDVVELALERALRQQATLEIVRGAAARERLAAHAPIGALARF